MPYVPAICPNCGADLSVDTEQEKGYCVHCGSMIDFRAAIQSAIFTQPIEFEGYEGYSTLVGMIDEDLRMGNNQTPEFRDMLNRAIELNPDDVYLYSLMESKIWNAKIKNKVLVRYEGTAEKVVVPEGVEIIEQMAFGQNIQLKEVSLPKSLKLINQGAFFYESKLTINAYAGSYGARYAMSSPAKLNIIDKVASDQDTVEEIESILREFDTLKKDTHNNLEAHFDRVYSTKWLLVLLVLSPAFYWLYVSLQDLFLYIGLLFLAIFYIILTFIAVAAISGYREIKRQVAIKRQMRLFLNKCNYILNPLGIIDFAYKKNIFDNSYDYLESELVKLRKAKKRVFQLDFSEIYKKPRIYYSLFDYFSGNKPMDYNRK